MQGLRIQGTALTRKGKVLIRKLIGSWSQWEEVAEMLAIIIKRFLLGEWIGVRVLRLRKCLHSLADTNYFWGLSCFSKLLSSCAFIFFQCNTFHESCIFKHHKKKKKFMSIFLNCFFASMDLFCFGIFLHIIPLFLEGFLKNNSCFFFILETL